MPSRRRALGLLLALPLAGCCDAGDGDRSGESEVGGVVDRQTFPRDVDEITIAEVGGDTTTLELGSDGAFAASLREGGTYRLLVGGGWPLVLRSGIGRLDTTVFVASGGATADIGEVRFWRGGTAGRAVILGTEPGECVDGTLETGEPCASGEAAIGCEDRRRGKRGKHDKHHDDDHDDDDDDDDDDDRTRCQDGIDADTGSECNGGPTAFDASPYQPQAIPTLNLPDVLGCDDDDDDDDDDD